MNGEATQPELGPRARGRVLACEAVLYSEFGRRSDAIGDRVIAALRAESGAAAGQLRPRPAWTRFIGPLAASLLVAAGAWWVLQDRPPPGGEGTVREAAVVAAVEDCARCSVFRARPGAGEQARLREPLRAGMLVREGDRLETGAGGRAELSYEGGAAGVSVAEHSTLTVHDSALARLAQGRLTGHVSRRDPARPFVVETPHARLTVIGTAFSVQVSRVPPQRADAPPAGGTTGPAAGFPSATRLEVVEGAVRLTRLADGASVDVSGGYAATVLAEPGHELKPVPLAPAAPARARRTAVFAHEFDEIGPDYGILGNLVRLGGPGGGITAIASLPCEGSPTFNPDQNMEFAVRIGSGPRAEPLFTLPEQVEIRVRIRSERPGTWSISHFPINQDRSFPEHFYSGEFPVGPEWREVVLHADDLKPYRREGHTRDLVPGLGITGFDIHGFGAGRLFLDRYEVRGGVR
ncbi:MAG: FecR domain-containing protein [Kiritimatiellae bacterium]|nr:FecR domain-containing protein [Kiritimatiellia bacterium]